MGGNHEAQSSLYHDEVGDAVAECASEGDDTSNGHQGSGTNGQAKQSSLFSGTHRLDAVVTDAGRVT